MSQTKQGGYRRGRMILGGIVGAALAGVALLPDTGWLVRQQVRMMFFGPASSITMQKEDQSVTARQAQAAASRPRDFPLQMALATRREQAKVDIEGEGRSNLTALQRLESRFSNEPSLYAAILRDLSQSAVKLDHRIEQFELQAPDKDSQRPGPSVSPKALLEWLRAAEQGGKLDPDNAFFPWMQAVGLYADHRDREALAQIRRAGVLPRYDDYVRDEATGGWALAEVSQGANVPALPRAAISGATLLPHYAVMRAAARLTAVQALHLELAGNIEEGIAVRQALARFGARMRTDSNWLIGNFVGEAIAAIAQARPGGAPPLPDSVKSDVRAALRIKRYEAYLTRIGHSEEIPWVEHEVAARKEIRVISSKGLDKGPSSIASLIAITVWWALGMTLLGNMLWMVAFGALATWLSRTRSVRNGERLPSAVSWGVGLSLAPLTVVVASLSANGGMGGAVEAVSGMLATAALAAVVVRNTPSHRSSARLVLCSAAVTMLFGVLLYWMSGSISGYASQMNSLLSARPDGSDADAFPARLLTTAVMTAVPLLTWIVLAIASRIRRVPVSVGTVRGFARAALPIAAVLALAYVGVVTVTSAREAVAQKALTASVQHEGRAFAAFAGRVWPAFAP